MQSQAAARRQPKSGSRPRRSPLNSRHGPSPRSGEQRRGPIRSAPRAISLDTPLGAAVWAAGEQSYAERELAALALSGVVERRESAGGPVYEPRDGHLIVELHVALAHGREGLSERHPRLLRRRRRVTSRTVREIIGG